MATNQTTDLPSTVIPQNDRERERFFKALAVRMGKHPKFQKAVRERYQKVYRKRIHRSTVSSALRGEDTSQPIIDIAFQLLGGKRS